MSNTVKLHSLTFFNAKTYLFAAIFVAGNLILPQLCHFVPQGGPALLPLYFFTLIAAYKFGMRLGLLTAVLSPVASSLFFGMPAAAVLPVILFKSMSLAVCASLAAHYFKNVTIWALLLVVAAYQLLGTAFEWVYTGSFAVAVQSLKLAIPGMLLQVVGGYALLKAVAKL